LVFSIFCGISQSKHRKKVQKNVLVKNVGVGLFFGWKNATPMGTFFAKKKILVEEFQIML
jgi:hypothetical protein